MEKNVCVWIGQHESPRKVVPRDEAVGLTLLILAFKNLKCVLDVEVGILQEQLTLLLNYHFRLQQLVPELPVQVSGVLRKHLFVGL
jgi:hypothetical protein